MQDLSPQRNMDGVYRPPQVATFNGAPKPPRKKIHWWRWALFVVCVLIVSGVTTVFVLAQKWSAGSFVGQEGGIFNTARDFIRGATGDVKLEGEESGVVRILLLGIGGEGHDGPYLSDTIILAQLKLETGEIALTNLPRDYQVKLPYGGYRKINAAFAEGFYKNKDWNEAGSIARQVVKDVSGLDIPYFAVIDFSGFEKAVDEIGGVDVIVERTFTDYQYPNSTNGYLPAQTFTAGPQHMDGKTALIFSRSRHAAGPEGSDFARGQRQQKVIAAFRQKVQSLNLITDSSRIATLLQTFASHFHTNLTPGQVLRLAKEAQKVDSTNIVASSLDPVTGLICPEIAEESGAYILVPCYGKTTADIQAFFANALVIGKLSQEKSVVWIATKDAKSTGYRRVASTLEQAGLTVWPITYADVEPEVSVVYQVNKKPFTAQYIQGILEGREVTVAPPNIKIDATRSDIILVLGATLPTAFTKPIPPPPAPKPTVSPTPSGTPSITPKPSITPTVTPSGIKISPTPTPSPTPSKKPTPTSLKLPTPSK